MNELSTHSITLPDRHDTSREVQVHFMPNEVAITCSEPAGGVRATIGAALGRDQICELRDHLTRWLKD